jgi:hypothetical protein
MLSAGIAIGKIASARARIFRSVPAVAVTILALMAASAVTVLADISAYEEVGNTSFGTLDLNTGVYTQIGVSGLLLSGLGEVNGVVYGGAEESNVLYSVNTSTGALTAIGTNNVMLYGDTGSTLTGLYAIGRDSFLYSINVSTGAATQIGYLGTPIGGVIGMSSNSSTLYYTSDDNLYTVNTTTGAATLVGSTGSLIGAMVTVNGTLYAGVESPLLVDTLNPATAVLTTGPAETGAPSDFWGLVPESVTPEPGYSTLVGLGIAILVLLRRRMKATA